MATVYDANQLGQYFTHIGYPKDHHPSDGHQYLSELHKYQLARVPFECLSLHYSKAKTVTLDPQALFEKIVIKGRGGYCLENNAFSLNILRSLGFQVISVMCRISFATRGIFDGTWRGMSHMANIVKVDGTRYLVDVGYGADGPSTPLPLVDGREVDGLPGHQHRLSFRNLAQHNDAEQRVWVYSIRRGQAGDVGQWSDVYCFIDAEMLPADFEVLNYYNMSKSLFAQTVVVQRFVLDEERKRLVGSLLLVRDSIRFRDMNHDEEIQKLATEEERVMALQKHFRIELTDEERQAVYGTPSQLKG